MVTEQAFLADIQEHPDDDAPRLVYADWLEEHGQPERAELIRVQIALADPPDDLAAYRALRVREGALLDEHGKEWFEPLKKVGVRAWVLRRGLVEHLAMPASKFLAHGEELFALAPIQAVSLAGARRILGKLAEGPLLGRLRGLDLSDNDLEEAEVRSLLSPHLAGLRSLNLSDNPLGPAGVQALADSPHLAGLRRLALRKVKMGEEGVRALVGHIAYPRDYARSVHLAGLLALDIRRNTIYEEGVCELVHSPHLAGLTELSFKASTPKSMEELQDTRYLRNLATIRISGDFREGIPGLLHCKFVKQLGVLDLSETRANDWDVAEEIATCRHLGELRALHLAGNNIGDHGVRALASSPHLAKLRRLDLGNNGVTSAGVRALCGSTLLDELEEVDLSGNRITDVGARALVGCSHLPRLCRLFLSDNRIRDAGAVLLAGAPLLRQLEGLSVDCPQIGKSGVSALRRAARKAGLPRRGPGDFWIDPQWATRDR